MAKNALVKISKEMAGIEIVEGATLGSISGNLKAINNFQRLVKSQLRKGHDYDVIPGTKKLTLLQPGAEKIAKLLNCADTYEIIDKVEDWDAPLFSYTVKCVLKSIRSGEIISEGIAECNSRESKYRYRWVGDRDIPKGINKADLVSRSRGNYTVYRIDNDDICSQKNTILKMSEKRALVYTAKSAGRLSDIFTQDIEDIEGFTVEDEGRGKPPVSMPKSKSGNNNIYKEMLDSFKKAKKQIGDKKYYKILGANGFEHANEVRTVKEGNKILEEMREAFRNKK